MSGMVVAGVELEYRRKIDTWVAAIEGEIVWFLHPPGCAWTCKRPFAREPIAVSKTVDQCVREAKGYLERVRQARQARIALILSDPIVAKHLA